MRNDNNNEWQATLLREWRRLTHTRFGRWLTDGTGMVHDISREPAERDQDGEQRHSWPFLLALPLLPLPLAGLAAGSMTIAMLDLPLLGAMGFTALAFSAAYHGSIERDQDRFDTTRGLMDLDTVRRRISGKALSRAADHMLPATRERLDRIEGTGASIPPREAGILIGRCHGEDVWMSLERPVYILAPARTGKTTRFVVPAIMEAPGPVVATSSRRDILDATFTLRTTGFTVTGRKDCDGGSPSHEPSPAWVFDPTGILEADSPYASHAIAWDPVAGCRDPARAQSTAAALVGSEDLNGENATWAHIGVQIVQSLLLAGAIEGKGIADVYQWAQDTSGLNHARTTLDESDDPDTRQWAKPLKALTDDDARTRSNKMLTVSNAFAALSVPGVRSHFPTGDGPRFDMRSFLRSKGTVYILAPLRNTGGQAEASASMFVSMFLNELRDTARTMAAHSDHGKLEPPVTLVLDEVANIAPWEGLPQLDTAGTGDGIVPVQILQSRAQARAAFGEGEEKQMWDNSQKIVMGGLSTTDSLRELSDLSGTSTRTTREHSWNDDWTMPGGLLGLGNTMERSSEHANLGTADIRSIPTDRALLINGTDPAAAITLIPMWERGWQAMEHRPGWATTAKEPQ